MTTETCWACGVDEADALRNLENEVSYPTREDAASDVPKLSEAAGTAVKIYKVTITSEEDPS
jgi:hypothetical protein